MKKHELLKYAYDNYPKGVLARFKTAPKVDHISTGKFRIIEGTGNGTCVISEDDNHCFYTSHGNEWAEIVKPKIAVKVDNAKQADAIYMHFGSGYKGELNTSILIYIDKDIKSMGCNGTWDFVGNQPSDYQIIQFAEFAKERGIKLPLITTLDGHDLFDGDYYIVVSKNKENWQIFTCSAIIKNYAKVISDPDNYKAFHDKQNALSWIEAQKPKPVCKQTIALKKSADLWNAFVDIKDSEKHPDDTNDFRFHIHALQNILYTQKHVKDHGKI